MKAARHDFAGAQHTRRGRHLRELARLRHVRDRIDREYQRPGQ
jgi:hypothetical protein